MLTVVTWYRYALSRNNKNAPDLIINPYACPSGMTVAMVIESIAAKMPGGSLNGEFVDATPFASSVEDPNGEWISESESLFDKIGSILGCRSMVLTTAVLRAPKKVMLFILLVTSILWPVSRGVFPW
ncbi:hypothetical protein SAY87_029300 [Trapa incisa]|uniref:DNA-directed RNA polymerase n=1 Tax=Trapa incisa TaxID=236973 RepID=A0AAN7Q7Y5_9MYRT|nr:hypothetical protein SAY87_029300 [Trapa incisa]